MKTASRKPDSVSSVNITPLAPTSLRTMCCTPTEIATCRDRIPGARGRRWRGRCRARHRPGASRRALTPTRARSGSSPAARRTTRSGGPPRLPRSAPRAPSRHCRAGRSRREHVALEALAGNGVSRIQPRMRAAGIGEARNVFDVEARELRRRSARRARPARGNRDRPARSSQSRRARARLLPTAARSSRRAKRSCRRRTRRPSCAALPNGTV